MNDEEFEFLKELLSQVSDMDLLSIHSYLRLEHKGRNIEIMEMFETDTEMMDISIPGTQLLAYIEVEFQHRNLN